MLDLASPPTLRAALPLARASLDVGAGVDAVQAHYGAAPGLRRLRYYAHGGICAFLAARDRDAIVAFRGPPLAHLETWLADESVALEFGPFGRVQSRLLHGLDAVAADLLRDLDAAPVRSAELFLTGHGVGGALAVLAAARLAASGRRPSGVHTFGQPRVGDEEFCAGYDAALRDVTHRFVNAADFVPRLPPRLLGYDHVGRFLWFGRKGSFVEDPGVWTEPLTESTSGSLFALDRLRQLRAAAPQGIEDHRIERYVERIERNLATA